MQRATGRVGARALSGSSVARASAAVAAPTSQPLAGRRALVVGVASHESVAYGVARALRAAGAELAVTYPSAKAERHVRPLAEELGAALCVPLDVRSEPEMAAAVDACGEAWGGELDCLVHSVAFCNRDDLHNAVSACSRDGFADMMNISVWSLLRLSHLAAPLMRRAGAGRVLTCSFNGGAVVEPHYGVMSLAKAALESGVQQLAVELGPDNITVNALSPGPIPTRAASGLAHFDDLIKNATERNALGRLADIDDCGALAAFLVGDGARNITGGVHFVDSGYHFCH